MKTFSEKDDSNKESVSIGSPIKKFSKEIDIFSLKIVMFK